MIPPCGKQPSNTPLMKKILTLFASITCVLTLSTRHAQAQAGVPSNHSVQFMPDITIENNTLANQRHVRIATAFNGWVFAAYLVNDSVSHKGGVVVRFSKDGGITWMPFNNYPYYQHSMYTSCDITVVGADTTHMAVFVGDVRLDLVSKKYEVEVQRYNPLQLTYPTVAVYFRQLDSNKVYDMALANDYRQPAAGDTLGYSLGLLYNHHGFGMDTMFFATTVRKTLNKFGKARNIATAKHFRYVSLAYSHSFSAHNGTYNAAWESLDTIMPGFGHVYVSRTFYKKDSTWITPVCLDSLNPNLTGRVRSPSIACQSSSTDNDSTNATAAVTFDYAENGFADSLDVFGFYNNRADSTNTWNLFALAATHDKEMQANINYDPIGNKFLATYFDSTSGSLVYLTDSVSMNYPWSVGSARYNDATANLKEPWPRVVINPNAKKAFFAWVVDPSNNNGIVKCDGQYLYTSTGPENELNGIQIFNPYPNPSASMVILPVYSDLQTDLKLTVFNTLGEAVVAARPEHLGGGALNIEIDVTSLASGVYFCRLESTSTSRTLRIVVQH
jgi:hypothetical protein